MPVWLYQDVPGRFVMILSRKRLADRRGHAHRAAIVADKQPVVF